MYYGPEFISRAILRWVLEAKIDTAFIDPGKPWQNGSNESFNGKFRDECLGMQWFKNRIDAKILIEEFRRQFNEVRPHSSLGQLTPAEFKQKFSYRGAESRARSTQCDRCAGDPATGAGGGCSACCGIPLRAASPTSRIRNSIAASTWTLSSARSELMDIIVSSENPAHAASVWETACQRRGIQQSGVVKRG